MFVIPRFKVGAIVASLIIGIILVLPNFIPLSRWAISDPINLGLDLRGGAQLLLEVDFERYHYDLMQINVAELRKQLRHERIRYQKLTSHNGIISLQLLDQEQVSKLTKIARKLSPDLNVTTSSNKAEIYFTEASLSELRTKVQQQSLEVIRRRVDEYGNKEISLQTIGTNRIELQVPGVSEPEVLRSLIGKTAKLSFHLVKEDYNYHNEKVPADVLLLPVESGNNGILALHKEHITTGDMLVDAQATFQQGKPVVSFKFNNLGARKFAEATKQNVKKRLAIVLDEKILSAPAVSEPILSGEGIISGNFTIEGATELAVLLRAGALPAPLKIAEERSLGPSLGEDSIIHGKQAVVVGFAFVVGFMILTYGRLGIIASAALTANILLLFALLAWLQSTLTLPGIAGIVLTMGMAVDANVLIFERIKEELQDGNSLYRAVSNGFNRAWAAIIDSNITTLIVAFLLYIFGSGPVRGFAVTLSLGITISMYTAVVLTKLLVQLWCNTRVKHAK